MSVNKSEQSRQELIATNNYEGIRLFAVNYKLLWVPYYRISTNFAMSRT